MISKKLVVYYSRDGSTRKIAEEIAKEIKADVCEIIGDRYKGLRGYFKAGFQAIFKIKPEIKINKNTDNYDLIIIGTPNWGGKMSSPVRSFISNREFKDVAFFCTQGGKGAEKVFGEMRKLIKRPLAEFFINVRDIESGEYKNKLKEFYKNLKK